MIDLLKIEESSLPGVYVLIPHRHEDDRGYFCETWNSADMAARGLDLPFVQDNQSFSANAGTIRGLHLQAPPMAQAKLVRCGRGALLDVAVDIRNGSPTFGRWVSEELSAENGKQMLIPEGFLHGFATLQPNTEILYKCSAHYRVEHEMTVRFDDPALAIDWKVDPGQVVVSDRDLDGGRFEDFISPFQWVDPRGTT